jgi:hypothetical protein
MPIIPATWETEIVGSQLKANLGKKLVRPYCKEQACAVVHVCNPSYTGGRSRRIMILGHWEQSRKDCV